MTTRCIKHIEALRKNIKRSFPFLWCNSRIIAMGATQTSCSPFCGSIVVAWMQDFSILSGLDFKCEASCWPVHCQNRLPSASRRDWQIGIQGPYCYCVYVVMSGVVAAAVVDTAAAADADTAVLEAEQSLSPEPPSLLHQKLGRF